MRGECLDVNSLCAGLDNVPNHVLCDAIAPNDAIFAYRCKELAADDGNAFCPYVNRNFDPRRNRNCTYAAGLSHKVNNRPVILAMLDSL